MKTSNNKQRLKTYKIKNHDSGKTYSVKAVNYTDAKTKYNKHILKDNRHTFEALWYTDPDYDKMMTQTFATEKEAMDFYRKNKGKPTFHGWWVTERYPGSWAVKKELVMDSITEDKLPLVEKIGDYTIMKNDDDFLKFAVFYKGQIIAETTTISVAKRQIKQHMNDSTKDSLTEDGWESYTFKTGLRSDAFKQYLRDRGIYFEASQNREYTHFEVKNADEAVDRRANEIIRQLKDALTEDAVIYIGKHNGVQLFHNDDDNTYSATVYTKYLKENTLKTLKAKIDEAKNEHSRKYRNLDSIIEDADIAQTDIKSTYLPEDANADNIQYLGFNEKRKLSFYGYGDRYFVHYDLEGRTEEVDKETVQKILKKNILGEIDENDLTNKEPQSEEIVSDAADIVRELNDMMYEYGYSKTQFQKFLKDVHLNKFTDKQFNEFGIKGRQEVIDYAKEVKAWKFDSFDWKKKQERGDK